MQLLPCAVSGTVAALACERGCMRYMHLRRCMQDSRFINIDAINLMWAQDALFMADGLTFSNVTTAGAQWGANGGVVRGDGDAIVYAFTPNRELVQPALPSASLEDDRVPALTPEDVWFQQVQEVRLHPLRKAPSVFFERCAATAPARNICMALRLQLSCSCWTFTPCTGNPDHTARNSASSPRA